MANREQVHERLAAEWDHGMAALELVKALESDNTDEGRELLHRVWLRIAQAMPYR